MAVPVLQLVAMPGVAAVVGILNYAAKNGRLHVRIPVYNSDEQIRNLMTTLQQILPMVYTVSSENVCVKLEVVGDMIVMEPLPHGKWPPVFLATKWATLRTGPRSTSPSYERWLSAALAAHPRWELATARSEAAESALYDALETAIREPFVYVQAPEESISVEYKVLDLQKPLSPETLLKKIDSYLMPFLRSPEPFTITFGVNDDRAPKGVVLDGPVGTFLEEAKEELVNWLLGLWPPLDIESAVLAAYPAPVLKGPLQCIPRRSTKPLVLKAAIKQTNKRELEAFEFYSTSAYCDHDSPVFVLAPCEEANHNRATALEDLHRIPRYLLELSVKWRSVDANGILVRHSTMQSAPLFERSTGGVVRSRRKQAALDLWLAAHEQPSAAARDVLCNPMVSVFVLACRGAAHPRLLPGCEPAATYDVTNDDDYDALKRQVHGCSPPWVLLVALPEEYTLAASLAAKLTGNWLGASALTYLQAGEGTPVQAFLYRLDSSLRVAEVFRTPRSPPSFACAAQQAGLHKYTAATVATMHRAAVPSVAVRSKAALWIEGKCEVPIDNVVSGLAQPLNTQADRIAEWICTAVQARPPQVEVLQVAKLFLCCGATTLLRIAAARAVQQCRDLALYCGDNEQTLTSVVTADLVAHITQPAVFILEAATSAHLEALRSANVLHPVIVLTSARLRPMRLSVKNMFVCNPFVDLANVEALCRSLGQVYPDREEQLCSVQNIATATRVPEMRHVLVFTLAALRGPNSSSPHDGVVGFVQADLQSVKSGSRPLLFALAFAGYFAEAFDSHYVPLSPGHAKGITCLVRRGSLLRRTPDGRIGFWHPWLARIVLEELAYSDSWLHVLDEGLIAALRALDAASPLYSRKMLRELLISRPSEAFDFSKLVTCYREAVGPNRTTSDHFPDVHCLAEFLGAGASDETRNEFMASLHVLQSRLHRLHFCPDYASAVGCAEDAVTLCNSFENRHNLARARIEIPQQRCRGISQLLVLRNETTATWKKKQRKKRSTPQGKRIYEDRQRMLTNTARKAINKLPDRHRGSTLREWVLEATEDDGSCREAVQAQLYPLAKPLLSADELQQLLDAACTLG